MKQCLMLKVSSFALAMALGFGVAPSFAADGGYSDTYSNPQDSTQGGMDQQTPSSDMATPNAADDNSMSSQQRGAQGPIRYESEPAKPWYAPTTNSGFTGYLQWQQHNSNTP